MNEANDYVCLFARSFRRVEEKSLLTSLFHLDKKKKEREKFVSVMPAARPYNTCKNVKRSRSGKYMIGPLSL